MTIEDVIVRLLPCTSMIWSCGRRASTTRHATTDTPAVLPQDSSLFPATSTLDGPKFHTTKISLRPRVGGERAGRDGERKGGIASYRGGIACRPKSAAR
jgi:hypothetical protein